MKRALMLLVVAAALFVYTINGYSTTISYTYTGSGTGSIGGTPFESTDFTISATGDTDNRLTYGPGEHFINNTTASIAINNVGTYSFITPTMFVIVNNAVNHLVYFCRADNWNALLMGPSPSNTWDMLTSIGPVGSTGRLLQWGDDNVDTIGGILFFSGNTNVPVTFQATVGSSTVPIPAAVWLFGSGLLGLFGVRRKMKK